MGLKELEKDLCGHMGKFQTSYEQFVKAFHEMALGGIGWWEASDPPKGEMESIIEEVIDEQKGVDISITPKKPNN